MIGFLKTRQRLKKVRASERVFAEQSERQPDGIVDVIIRTTVAGYVPKKVKLRTRIDDKMITATTTFERLEELERDDKVAAVSVSRSFNLID